MLIVCASGWTSARANDHSGGSMRPSRSPTCAGASRHVVPADADVPQHERGEQRRAPAPRSSARPPSAPASSAATTRARHCTAFRATALTASPSEHDRDDDDEDREREVVVVPRERVVERGADAARADDADDRRVPQVHVPVVDRQPDDARQHLRQHAVDRARRRARRRWRGWPRSVRDRSSRSAPRAAWRTTRRRPPSASARPRAARSRPPSRR